MQEIFYEESVTTQDLKGPKFKYLITSISSIVSAVFIFIFVLITVFSNNKTALLLGLVFVVLSTTSFIFLRRKKETFILDFDYTFVSGSIRISKIFNGKRRKNIINFNTSDLITIGKEGSPTHLKLQSDKNNKAIVATPNQEPSENKQFYYLHYLQGGTRYIVVIECSELFIYNILKFSSKTILEQGFVS